MSQKRKLDNESYSLFKVSGPPPFDTIGLFTFLRTYARRRDENDPNSMIETWEECLQRVVTACNTQLNVNFTEGEMQELFHLLYNLKCSVAGRFLWQLGTKTISKLGLPSLQNCAAIVVNEPIHPFTWVMNLLMLGAGCGFRILPSDLERIPTVKYALNIRKDSKDADFITPDSREGWVKLLGKILKSHFYSGESFTYSCLMLRSRGAPIKSFGGLASGPEILCEGMMKIDDILNRRAEKKLRPVDALDIMNIIGMVVVSGNVRRCIPENYMVHTRKGLIPIQDIVPGVEVLTHDGYKPVERVFHYENQPIITIITRDGIFECTENHRMAVLADINKVIWVEASKLQPGHRLITSGVAIEGEPQKFPELNILVDEDICWLLGIIQNRATFHMGKYFFMEFLYKVPLVGEKITNIFKKFGDIHIENGMGKYNYLFTHVFSDHLTQYFSTLFTHRISHIIFQNTLSCRLAYIAGVADSNGTLPVTVITVDSNFDYAHDIQTLLYSCGIESGLKVGNKPTHIKVNLYTLQSQKKVTRIPQLIQKIKERQTACCANNFPVHFNYYREHKIYKNVSIDRHNNEFPKVSYCPVDVVSVNTNTRLVDTYDLEIQKNNNYYCNGYMVHNSALLALGDCKDIEYLRAKRWDLGTIPNYRAYSNNSVVCNDINEILDNDEFWQGYHGNGEPYGLINLRLSQSCGRLGDTQYPDPDVIGYNPCAEQSLSNAESCVTGNTIIHTDTGCYPIAHLVGKRVKIYNGDVWSEVTPFLAKKNDDFIQVTFSDGSRIKVTPYHQFSVGTQKIRAENLEIGMCMPQFSLTGVKGGETTEYSYTLGTRVYKNLSYRVMGFSKKSILDFLDGWINTESLSKKDVRIIWGKESKLRKMQILLRRVNINFSTLCQITSKLWALRITTSYSPQKIISLQKCNVQEPSYCFSEPLKHMGVFANVLTYQCCLAELYLPNINTQKELFQCATYLYRICKHSLMLPCKSSAEMERIVHKNMRMGIGVTGYMQASEEQRNWLSPCYEYLRKYDRKYSIEHGFPVSIKLTTTKPSGTLSLLGGVTPGIHPGFSRYYIRRIRISSESPLIVLAKSHGYPIEYVRNFDGSLDHTTQIISFPCKLPKDTILAENCTAVQQLEWVKKVQSDYSDNSVSVTVYYRKEEIPLIKEWLKNNYNNSIKTASFLLHQDHGFLQAPLEKISKEQYDEMVRGCRPITSTEGICYVSESVEILAQNECVGNSCPLR